MTDRTPEQTRSLALERVTALFENGWADFDGPLLKGLYGDAYNDNVDVIDEMVRITDGLKVESASNPTPTMVWEVVGGGLPNYPWWEWFEYSEGADWETPGTLTVTAENPQVGDSITKSLTALDMLHAYLTMPNRTHCGGCDLIGDPDACSSDLILQQAMYGEIVYG